MRLALQLASETEQAFAAAARRLRQVDLVAPDTAYDAIVTGDPDTACAAAQAGRSVLLHHWGPRQLRLVDQACRSADVTLMTSHPWRFRPSVEALMERHRDGKLGAPGLVRIHSWSATALADITLDAILPELDLIVMIFGRVPQRVYAVSPALAEARFMQLHLGFAEGGMALVDFASLPQCDGYESRCLIGANGAAYADDHHNMNLLFADGMTHGLRTDQGTLELGSMLREFVTAVEQGRPPTVTAADTLAALRTAEAALEAARSSTALSPQASSP